MSEDLAALRQFPNQTLARQAMSGRLDAGGRRKIASCLAAEIDGFGELWQQMEAAELVALLGLAAAKLSACVEKTGGVSGPVVQGTLCASWGAAGGSGSLAHDALNASRAALLARTALLDQTASRRVRLNCAIHTDQVVSGLVTGADFVDYPVTGEAPRVAAAAASKARDAGADILITESVWSLVKEFLILEEAPPLIIDGKPLRLFAVINMNVARPGVSQPPPETLAELRRMLGLHAAVAPH